MGGRFSPAHRWEVGLTDAARNVRVVQLAPGMLIAWERRAHRIVSTGPCDAWPAGVEAEWNVRPAAITVERQCDPADVVTLLVPDLMRWHVLPEHHAACSVCGEVSPCRHELADVEARKVEERALLLAAQPQDGCTACGEEISSRQHSVEFPGEHLWQPGSDRRARFHTRRSCMGLWQEYQRDLWRHEHQDTA